jgi:hypothetical protein
MISSADFTRSLLGDEQRFASSAHPRRDPHPEGAHGEHQVDLERSHDRQRAVLMTDTGTYTAATGQLVVTANRNVARFAIG